jgi:hypothetical protein
MNIAGNAKIKPEELDAGVEAAWNFATEHVHTLLELKRYGQAIMALSDVMSDDELRGAFFALGDAIFDGTEKLERAQVATFHAMHPIVYPGAREEYERLQAGDAPLPIHAAMP